VTQQAPVSTEITTTQGDISRDMSIAIRPLQEASVSLFNH